MKTEGSTILEDATEPETACLVDLLEHIYPGPLSFDVPSIKYVHYMAMRAYSAAEMLEERDKDMEGETLRECSRVLDELLQGGAVSAPRRDLRVMWLARAESLQEALWNSLTCWRKYYDNNHQTVIGQYFTEVCIEHLRRYGRLFRPDFLFSCIWNRTALVHVPHMGELQRLSASKVDAIREGVASLRKAGVSVIAGLCKRGSGSPHLAWWDSDLDPRTDGFPALRTTEHLSDDQEAGLNESLAVVFGASQRD